MKTIRSSSLASLVLVGSLLGFTQGPVTAATAVKLQSATATFSQTEFANFSVARTIDDVFDDNMGWAIAPQERDQTAVWETAQDIGYGNGTLLTFSLIHSAAWMGQTHSLGRFRLSITTDDRSTFADGLPTGGDVTANWVVLQPTLVLSANGATLSVLNDNSILASGDAPRPDTYIVMARTTLTGITGIRLEALQHPSLPSGGPGRAPGNGNFVLSEMRLRITEVPEPSAASLLGLGLVVWAGSGRLFRRPKTGV